MSAPRIQYAEEIARKWFPGSNEIKVVVARSATLDDELREVVHRRLERISITWARGESSLALGRDEIVWLRSALDAALVATEDFAPAEHGAPGAGEVAG
jgi:hypothetical protein